MKNAQYVEAAASKSRILIDDVPEAPVNKAVCESCHWDMLTTRRFRGRVLCLACIAEHFSEGDDD